MKQLKFNQTKKIKKNIVPCKVFVASFDRPNLSWQIVSKNGPGVNEKALEQLLELCQEERFENKCGIVYCRTREDTEVTSQCKFFLVVFCSLIFLNNFLLVKSLFTRTDNLLRNTLHFFQLFIVRFRKCRYS